MRLVTGCAGTGVATTAHNDSVIPLHKQTMTSGSGLTPDIDGTLLGSTKRRHQVEVFFFVRLNRGPER